MRLFPVSALLSLTLLQSVAGETIDSRIALDESFPDRNASTYFSGEITLVEHVNRKGLLRLDRDGTLNKYFWDLPHEFQMLPYGAIYLHGAPAELRDLPLGTHLHGDFYLGPEGDFEVKPPVSGYVAGKMARPDLRSVESKFSRVFRFEDDFSFYQRQGLAWRIKSVAEDTSEIVVERIVLSSGKPDSSESGGLTGDRVFKIDEGTRFWKGRGYGTLADLSVGNVVQLNLSWVSLLGPQKQDGICRDIWIDQESRKTASSIQRGRHVAHLKLRGVGAKVMKTTHTPGKGAEGHVTIQLHAGIDKSLLEEIAAANSIFVRAAEPSLRTYDSNDQKTGHVKKVTWLKEVPAGSSGLQIEFHIYEMFEGLREGRTIRVGSRDWVIPFTPREEKLWPNDIRKFKVGPRHIADRDGPPDN